MTNAELWAVFFQYLTDEKKRGKITEIIKREEGIAMAVNTLVNITQDEIEYERMSNLIKSELDYQSGMENARCKGLAEGKLEIARNAMIKGLPIDVIHDITGLDIETLEQLTGNM
jgi:predicted transposase/invertase (TIGR01784 family)